MIDVLASIHALQAIDGECMEKELGKTAIRRYILSGEPQSKSMETINAPKNGL